MYGCPKTGKTTLAHAVANAAGANFFNLSPRSTDGRGLHSSTSQLNLSRF
jgi:SpoVK/Ycf46/Vps4 family AAA+-type ATPase